MSKQEAPPQPSDITQPVMHESDALVENIYPLFGSDNMPDLESQDIMGEYLIDRLTTEEGPRTRIVLTPSGRTMPGLQRIPEGFKEVTGWRKIQPKEWLISPRKAAAIVLGSMALFNVVGNHEVVEGSAKYAGHAIYRVFNPVSDHVVVQQTEVVTPGTINIIDVTVATTSRVGSSDVDPSSLTPFVDKVRQAEQAGGRLMKLAVTGNASDEWSDDGSVGTNDVGNTKLGQDRANAAVNTLSDAGLNVSSSELSINSQEHVVTSLQKEDLTIEANTDGYSSIKAAISAVDREENVPDSLAQKIKQWFTGEQNRGVSLSATMQYPGTDSITTETKNVKIPGKDNAPKIPEADWYWFLPLLPIRRRERYDKVKQQFHWKFTPSKPLMRPEIIREDQEQAWVRLRPEAANPDGTLVENAWAYTRKYEHLLRDNRIADVLRADYQNPKGDQKSLRVMFVDVAPAPETIEAFEQLLHKFSAMEDGKLGDRVSGIFVYLSENAGIAHDDPKRIAMGIDKQSSENILGTFTYPLDLVELHMPSTWSSEQLLTALDEFNGPAWVTSHEVAGHGTDITDQPLRLRRVHARGIPGAHVIEGEPRARKMSVLDTVLSKLPSKRQAQNTPIEFDISYPVTDLNGQVVTTRARVNKGDPRLAHATSATIVGFKPTVYANSSSSEHYAETAASLTTGITVPFREASVEIQQLQTDRGLAAKFADGYRPDVRGQELFTKSVGAVTDSFPITFKNPPAVKIAHINPTDDPLISKELSRTGRLRTLYPHQMIAILARVTRRSR